MLAQNTPVFLLASPDPALLELAEPVLGAAGARVEVAMTADLAMAALTAAHQPTLAVLDERLPGRSIDRLLEAARAENAGRRFPILLVAEEVTPEWLERLTSGIVDDLESRKVEPGFLAARIEAVMRNHARQRELDLLREAAALNAQTDRLTGVYNREAMLSILFRETDRVQRLKSTLCMILFDIDDFGHWNARLGEAACDDLLRQAVGRTARLLRSYDLLGRVGKDEFLVGLPGCSSENAVLLAERLRLEVFTTPFRAAGEMVRLSACFGVAASLGRSPVVVLRETEQALAQARSMGPESIQCAGDCPQPSPPPVAFLLENSGGELLAW
ncbi:MAG: diguanylate cyclase [Terracidiphilus sp.]